MSFLKVSPIVFVIENKYEILLIGEKNGLFSINVGGKNYYENNSGVRSSEKNISKIIIPQKVLDKYKKYVVSYNETIDRKSYFSQFGNLQTKSFEFKPLEKTDDIRIFHFADIHSLFDQALKTFSYYENSVDLLVINGDTSELTNENVFMDICNCVGNLSKGKIPVILTRGNHETRGKFTEFSVDYFPNKNKKFYYTFQVGALKGVVLDCGEDKWDNNQEYGGANLFEEYRKNQTKFLQSLKRDNNKLFFAISHICPACTTQEKNPLFDIERKTYCLWNKQLDKLNTAFMLTGHLHFYDILDKDDSRNTLPHNYPVIIGSAVNSKNKYLLGSYLTINGGKVNVKFVNNNGEIESERQIIL